LGEQDRSKFRIEFINQSAKFSPVGPIYLIRICAGAADGVDFATALAARSSGAPFFDLRGSRAMTRREAL
jgi:hypothetical protein